MPTYGYECLGCGNGFEVMQSIKADPLSTCEDCGGTLRKRVYPVGIAFKGSGFYVNDYAPKSGTASPAKSEGGSEGGSTGEAKADAKPAEVKSDAAPKPEAKAEPKAETKSEQKTPAAAV